MKLKKLMAAVLAAVMAAGILSGCVGGAGGSGSNASLDNGEVNRLLESVKDEDEEIQVNPLPELDSTLDKVTTEIQVKDDIGTQLQIKGKIMLDMNWFVFNGKQGLTFVVSDEKLKDGLVIGDVMEIIEKVFKDQNITIGNVDKVRQLGKIDTPEKLSAALILFADSVYGNIGVLEAEYNASARRTEAEDGTIYWVVAVQTTTSVNI